MQARAERPSIKGLKQIGSYIVGVRKVRFPNQHFQVIWRICQGKAHLEKEKNCPSLNGYLLIFGGLNPCHGNAQIGSTTIVFGLP